MKILTDAFHYRKEKQQQRKTSIEVILKTEEWLSMLVDTLTSGCFRRGLESINFTTEHQITLLELITDHYDLN